MQADDFIQQAYEKALKIVASDDEIKSNLDDELAKQLDVILQRSESSKGVLTVIITSVVYKLIEPSQNIKLHQTSIPDGYSGRTFDTKHITPFFKRVKFPAMAESGWLTRSLEQKVPYDADYSGAIRPEPLKKAFLTTIDLIEQNYVNEEVLSYLFQGLIIKRNSQAIDLAKPVNLPISTIITLLTKHFNRNYVADGAARLPVLALYAVYQCLINEAKRFEDKELLSIENHTSADSRSGRIGDIDIVDENSTPFEAVEVKHNIAINTQLVRDAFEKFKTTQVQRYYLLSTSNIDENSQEDISKEIERIKNIHGCHVIVNGLIGSLNYYLRMINSTAQFISYYIDLVEQDTSIKFEHKKAWNTVVSEL